MTTPGSSSRGGSSITDRYSAPPTSVRIPSGRSDARSGAVPAAPDYRARLRDLYARRTATTRLDADTIETRGDAVSRSLTPRYEPKLKSDLEKANPTPAPTPRSGSPRANPAPTAPRERGGSPPSGGAPRTGGSPGPSPSPRVTPISNRYRVPGREPRVTPSPLEPGSPRTTPRLSPTPTDPSAPRNAPRTPRADPEPRTPGLRPRTNTPRADPTPTPGGPNASPRRPNRSPGLTPVGPTDVVGNRGRGGGRGGNDPRLNPRGRGGGLGPRFSDHWYDYNSWSVAGSHRYLYGCYHWSGHCAAFWPRQCGWGSYWYPYLYCGSWYNYWYNCRSSFAVYWNSSYPYSARVAWWWPSYCYLPGSWFGFYGFSSWSSSYVDWSYVPTSTYLVSEVVREPVVVGEDEGGEDVGDSLAELAERHVKLGDYYFRRGRYEEAAESYVRALAYAPDDGALHFVLADALFAQGDYHYAAYMIGRGLKLDPELAKAVADKREFYDDPAEFEKQMDTLREYLAEKPYDAAAYLVLGYNLRFSDQPAEATKAFERVLEIDPGNEAARAFLEGLAEGAAAAEGEAAPAERSDKK